MPKKIVLFGDHPAAHSGLARILRDLALLIHHDMPDFEVATLGYGAPGSLTLPFPQYHWTERDDFLPLELPFIAEDFARGEPMILMTIGDIQRFLPLADPAFTPEKRFGEWITNERKTGKLALWGYFPIDSHSRNGGLHPQLAHTLSHYDRILVPSEWAKAIILKSLPHATVEVLPHGIDTSIFQPIDRDKARDIVGQVLSPVMAWPQTPLSVPEDALWVGIVATNQTRKDWGLGIETVAELSKSRPVMLWAHTDKLKREWSILESLSEHNLHNRAMITMGTIKDADMALAYSAMDITLGIGRGEGFSYPTFESIFCQTPCFASSYGAHAEYMDEDHLYTPTLLRPEGPLGLLRPVGDAEEWASWIEASLTRPMRRPDEMEWANLAPRFIKWFRDGQGG